MSDPPQGTETRKPLIERLSAMFMAEPEDRGQLLEILRSAQARELIDAEALSMIEGVMQVSELAVRDIMVPRSQMDVIDISVPADSFMPHVIQTAHSRFPVVENDRDNVLGILHAKELLRLGQDPNVDVRDLLRPAVFVPESKRLDVLLKDFRLNRNHLAIVVDEYGGVSGLVTIEDVLEQIVGEIEDEFDFDEESDHIVAIEDNGIERRYRVSAITEIDRFNDEFGTSFPDDEFDTIGGLITDQFGRVPRRGETAELEGLRFEVLRADPRQLQMLLVERVLSKPPNSGAPG
ncbi:MAG: transporter associated domain-containing protein [Burkholderiaceae bacterium]